MTAQGLYTEIVADLKKNADPRHAEKDKRYHKYDSYQSYGIRAPVLSRLLKMYKKDIVNLDCAAALALAQQFFQSETEEQLLAGNYILALKNTCLSLPKQAVYLDQLADNFMSWSTVDDFCVDALQPLLIRQPKETLTLLRAWNQSESLWKRRASVVAFVRKIGESGQFTKEIIELCDSLKKDPEDLVRKGVGWVLKDAMRGDKSKILAYVRRLRKEGAPSTIVLYAIRDLKGEERNEVINIKP